MDKYDDYTPHIFYNEDSETQNITEDNETSAAINSKTTRSKRTSSERARKTTKTKNKKEAGAIEAAGILAKCGAFFKSRTTSIVTGILIAGFSAYLIVAFVSYLGSCLSDQSIIDNHALGSIPSVSNRGGEGGARISEFLINKGFGFGAFVIIIWLVCIALKLLTGKPRFRTLDFTIKCLIGFITLSLIVGLLTIGSNTLINWGGYHGRYVNEWIIGFFGWWGALILCAVMVALFFVICMRDIIKWILVKKRILDEKRRAIMEKRAAEKAKARELAEQKAKETELDYSEKEDKEDEGNVFTESLMFEKGNGSEIETQVEPSEIKAEASLGGDRDAERDDPSESYIIPEINDEIEASEISQPEGQEELTVGEEEKMVVNVNHIAKAAQEDYRGKDTSFYKFPSFSLLSAGADKININPEELLANKEQIKQTLLEYGVPIVSIEAHVGPTVTLYEIRPDRGNRISRIKGLVDEIALSLSAIGVRIIAPIPGRGTIGIEVANLKPQTVSLRSILESREYQNSKASLPIAIGSTIQNEVFIADLASIPHLLVAGATGQGKSVGLNVIIMSLLFKKKPDELKFVMFDPKMVEFNLYAAIQKQYLAKLPEEEEAIVTDMNKVVPTLNSLCIEMDNRYALLKEAEVRKIEEYNNLIKSGKFSDDPKHKFLPYIVVVVDEFADLMMTAGKEVEMPIARLAQKARAVGIHVIIATQRPATTVITGNIKTNFPGRIAFKVSSGYDSKTILDTPGAEKLIGKGDMLILNNSELVRVQCAFIDTPEVKAICDHISNQPYPADSPYILPEPLAAEGSSGESSGISAAERDPLYDEIRNYVITSGVASTSNIQRKYQLGYNRAGRIMDQLEADGVVGPSQGGKARSVLVSS